MTKVPLESKLLLAACSCISKMSESLPGAAANSMCAWDRNRYLPATQRALQQAKKLNSAGLKLVADAGWRSLAESMCPLFWEVARRICAHSLADFRAAHCATLTLFRLANGVGHRLWLQLFPPGPRHMIGSARRNIIQGCASFAA